MSRVAGIASILLFAAWAGAGAHAQSIRGTVFDPDGGMIPKAQVMLMQDYMKLKEVAADESGCFSFVNLEPGRYQLQIKQPMFSLFQQTVELKGSEQAVIYAILPLGRMADGVRINARLAPSVRRNTPAAQKEMRAGGKIELAKILKFTVPEYPPGPDSRGVEGDVVLLATIKSDGSLLEPIVISSPDVEFDGDAVAAVKNWRYRPMTLNGRPVATQVVITLQYRLQ